MGGCAKQVVTKVCPSNPTPGSVSWEGMEMGKCRGGGRQRNAPGLKSLIQGGTNICFKLKGEDEIILDGHLALWLLWGGGGCERRPVAR